MKLVGLQKLTLLDFPGKVACTVFTYGCNFACPFCHNASLVVPGRGHDELSVDKFFDFLGKRRGILDGVVITGGEPMIHPDLPDFIRRIKSLGFLVKLDTNGSFPDRLAALVSSDAAPDYVAIDIKNIPEKYIETAGSEADATLRSVEILKSSGIDHEFRTTVVRGLHEKEDLVVLARMLTGEKYFLQAFVDSGDILDKREIGAFDAEEMHGILDAAKTENPLCVLRGID